MSIQIGNRTVDSMVSNRERIVVQSAQSNLIHIYSTSSNSYMLFESSLGALYNWGMSNEAFVLGWGDSNQTLMGVTPTGTRFPGAVQFSSDVYIPNPTTSNINTSYINIAAYQSSIAVRPLIKVSNSNVKLFEVLSSGTSYLSGPIGIGTTIPAANTGLHVMQGMKTETTLQSSNVWTNVISTANGTPLVVSGSMNVVGVLTLFSPLSLPGIVVNSNANFSLTTINAPAPTSTVANTNPIGTSSLTINQGALSSNVLNTTFGTSNYTGMSIDRYGHIGIGTIQPRAFVHVESKNENSSNIYGLMYLRTTSNSVFFVNSNACINIGPAPDTNPPSSAGGATAFVTATPNPIQQFYPDLLSLQSSNLLTVDKWANIGIGTSAPQYALHIAQSSNSGVGPLVGLEYTGEASNAFMLCTSNTNPVFRIDTVGHLTIGKGIPYPQPGYSIKTDITVAFPAVETSMVYAPTVSIITTSNTILTTPFTSNLNSSNTYLFDNLDTSSNTVFTSNIYFTVLNTSNIVNYIDNTSALVWSSNVLSVTSNTTSNVFVAAAGTCNIINVFTSNITSNITFTLTSNLNYFQSNIGFNGTNLLNIGTASSSNIVTSRLTAGNIISSALTTGSLVTSDLTINGFSVQNSNVTVSLSNFIFSGSAFCMDKAGVAQSNVLTQGKLRIVLDDTVAGSGTGISSRALVASGRFTTTMSLISREDGALIELTAQSANTIGPFYGQLGINSLGTMFIRVAAETFDQTKFRIAQTGTLSLGTSCTILGGNTGTGAAGYLGVGTTSPVYPLHVIGKMGVSATAVATPTLVVDTATTRVGVGISVPTANLHVIGTALVSGVVTAASVTTTSDRNLKTDLSQIINPIEKIKQLTGYTYKRTDLINSPRETGLIAQDLLSVLPEVVVSDTQGRLSVAYGNLAGLFVEAIKDLQSQITELTRRKECSCTHCKELEG